MRNRTTGKCFGNLFTLIQYLIIKYGKKSPRQLINLDQETKEIHNNPQSPIDTVFNQVRYLLECVELAISMYTQIQTTNIAFAIINKVRKPGIR